ncbi:hypothetical protein OHB01_07215 [Microbispora hainanensis]|uniref:Uncharacterized protein n=1 Tax=Microbispora hainanensis TaxID=568844 RepID=A0ABZ1SQG0_9ACTN|nr:MULTISPECIES: hypothetical protein [Microbispora]
MTVAGRADPDLLRERVLLAVLFGLVGWAHLQERRDALAMASVS